MARRKASIIGANNIKSESKSTPFGQFRWGESYTSLILGLIVVVIASVLIVSFAKNVSQKKFNLAQQTLSQKTEELKTGKETSAQEKIYTVVEGDDLWNISEKFYKTGYNWVAIAKANNLENPDIIAAGLKLKLPKLAIAQAQEKVAQDKTVEAKQDKTSNIESIKSNTYKVEKGDYLWDIAVRAYGDGYKWVDISRTNNLTDPNLIFSGNILKIPR